MSSATADIVPVLEAALGPQYRLGRELGRGGMGVVFQATDLALERSVAVKVINPELALNRALADRFIREARLIAKLRHPNIVTVYGAGAADGLLYYVMDDVPGETLRDLLLREGRLPADLVCRLVAEIAEALDAAARAGIVHRDIKPENILIERSGSLPRALLADFGNAHAVAAEDGTTGPGIAMGTPAYMSPEQASGDAVDGRSDLYSLGVVAYEMLTGRPPFEGPRRAVISRQIVDPPPPLDRHCPEAPEALVAAVGRALEKVPAARWQTGAEFREALLGHRVTPLPTAPRRRRRWPAAAAAAALVLAAAAWGMVGRGGPPEHVNPRHSFLVMPFGNLRDDVTLGWLSQGSVSMLDLALSQWREITVVGQEQVADLVLRAGADPLSLENARRAARAAGVWTVVMGEYERTRDSLHLVARAYDVATGQRLEVAEAWAHLGDDVREVFDALAAKLLDLSGAPPAFRAPLTAVTSSSLEAYRAYLRGLDHLNRWELADAEEFFREAVTVDTTFSLAFFRLAVTRGWRTAASDSVSHAALANATRFADRLPAVERRRIEAYRAMIEGEYGRAEALYGDLVAQDSTDADAWYGLGDAWFHDERRPDRAFAITRSLQAFRRTLALDPRFGLAYEHASHLLAMAAADKPEFLLMPGDRFVPAQGARADVAQAAVARARQAAVASARAWTEYQPAAPRAHRALLEAHLVGRDYPAALGEVSRVREVYPAAARPLAQFLEARVRLVMGDARAAVNAARQALTRFDPGAITPQDVGHELVLDVLSGANAFAFVGDLPGAEEVIRLADRLRQLADSATAAPVAASGDGRVWQSGRLAALYAAVGAPPEELRELWRRVSRIAAGAEGPERPRLALAGAAAAQGLLVGDAADPSALAELEAITGRPAPAEFQALAAVLRGDRATARSVLAQVADPEKRGALPASAAFAMGDPRPVVAETHFRLGNFGETLDQLEGFEPDAFDSRGFDPRWGLVARVRLLRGLALEKLGRLTEAGGQYQLVLGQWEGADSRLRPVVEEARAGLARIRGARG